MVIEAIRQEKLKEKETDDGIKCDFDTDDEDGDNAYDAWRLRELTRLKRDREERDQYVIKFRFFL
jgi:microfibrillar-associated protein 1